MVLCVAFTLLVLTPCLRYLPIAVLAVIIIMAVYRLIEIKEFIFIYKVVFFHRI